MAETVVWNKKLLVASLIAAILAAFLVYIYTSMQESKARGDMVRVWKWKRDIPAGGAIRPEDLEVVEIPISTIDNLKNVVKESDSAHPEEAYHNVKDPVRKEAMVRFSDFGEKGFSSGTDFFTPGKRGYTLRIDPNETPANLRVKGFIDIRGRVRVAGATRDLWILKNVRVVGIGGEGLGTDIDAGSTGVPVRAAGQRMFRSIEIELDPDVCGQMFQVEAFVEKFKIFDRKTGDGGDPRNDGKLDKDVLDSGVLSQKVPPRSDTPSDAP
jgi:hypothetical protein